MDKRTRAVVDFMTLYEIGMLYLESQFGCLYRHARDVERVTNLFQYLFGAMRKYSEEVAQMQ